MHNISLHGEDVLIEAGKSYYVIDALYLQNIKEELPNISNADDITAEIKAKVFPYTEAPFAMIAFSNTRELIATIKVSQIRKGEEENTSSKSFSTDTGVVLIIERSIFLDFLNQYEYDKLVEDDIELINKDYWSQLLQNFGKYKCGIILAPGTKSEFEFDGSGLYEIKYSD